MYEMLNRPASSPMPFLILSIWNPLVPLKVGFLCLGGVLGKAVDTRPTQKKGKTPSKEATSVRMRRKPYTSNCAPTYLFSLGAYLGYCWYWVGIFFFLFNRLSSLGKEPGWERNVRKCGRLLPFASFRLCGTEELE